jgi:hypothetical protein
MSFENVAGCSNLVTRIIRNKDYVQEHIRSRLNQGIACYRSEQTLLSCFLSESTNVKHKQRTVILLAVSSVGGISYDISMGELAGLLYSECSGTGQ